MARGPMAGVSGPGKFSKRTDGMSFESTEYGSGVANAATKTGAPLAKTPDVRATSLSEMGMAPSQMEPVTPLYASSGVQMNLLLQVLQAAQIRVKTSDTLAKLLPFDDTGEIAILYQEALARGN
jgi:hypothetical protein